MEPNELIQRIKGYLPCRIVSKKADKWGTVQVAFADNTRRRFPRYKVKGAEKL